MAEREAIVSVEERAAAIRAEAVEKREMVAGIAHDKVAPTMHAFNDAGLHETFERATPSVQPAAEQEASAPEADASPALNQQPSTPETNAAPAGTAQRIQAIETAPPSPAANADDFDDEVSAVHEKAAEFTRKTFFQQQAERAGDEMGIAAKTGAMTLGSIGVDRAENEQNAQKKRAEKDRLNQLLALLDNQIAGLYKDLDYWKEQEQKYITQEEALAKYIEGLESGVPADLSAEEQRALEEAIRAYEEKHKMKVDRNSPEQMRDVLEFATENRRHASTNRIRVEQQIDETEDLRRDMRENPNDPTVRQRLDELGLSEDGKRTLTRLTRNTSDDVKIAAAQSLDEDAETIEFAIASTNADGVFSSPGGGFSYGSPPAQSRSVTAASAIEDSPIGEPLQPIFAAASDPAQPLQPDLQQELMIDFDSQLPAPGGRSVA